MRLLLENNQQTHSFLKKPDHCCEGIGRTSPGWAYTSCKLFEKLHWQVLKFLCIFSCSNIRVLRFANQTSMF